MTQQYQNEQHQPPPSLVSHDVITYVICIAMAFSSASYFSFRFSNGSL
ncbi:hypothetical protein [Photobacterium phosphoreum]|nr:hypothetical protein [Photobacterium phosphoreum]MCD9519329.1 hypothetical protein [Photobacterium phosphoreum]